MGPERDYAATAEILLDSGSKVESRREDGKTALHIAAEEGDRELVAILLARGADVSSRTPIGDTPLHLAALGKSSWGAWARKVRAATGSVPDYRETAKLLIAHGAAVDAANGARGTPLYFAAVVCNREVAEVLLAHGADVAARSLHGETLLMGALRGHGETWGWTRMSENEAIERGECYDRMIEWLKEHGAKE